MNTHEESSSHLLSGWRFTALIAVIILSAGGYLLFVVWGGWDGVAAAFSQIGIGGTAAALALALLNYLLRFIRWQYYLHILTCPVPLWKSLQIYLSGFALTATPAKAGEMLRSIFLRDYKIGYHASLGAFLSERVSDLIAILLLALVGLWEYPKVRPVCLSAAVVIAAVVIILQQKNWLRYIRYWARHRLGRQQSNAIAFMIKILLAFRQCFSLRTLIIGIILGVIAWGAEGMAFAYILHLLGAPVGAMSALFIYAFSMLVGAITFLPGGLGGAELAMLELLMLYQVAEADAVAATIVIRLATLWFAVFLGLCVLPALLRRRSR